MAHRSRLCLEVMKALGAAPAPCITQRWRPWKHWRLCIWQRMSRRLSTYEKEALDWLDVSTIEAVCQAILACVCMPERANAIALSVHSALSPRMGIGSGLP